MSSYSFYQKFIYFISYKFLINVIKMSSEINNVKKSLWLLCKIIAIKTVRQIEVFSWYILCISLQREVIFLKNIYIRKLHYICINVLYLYPWRSALYKLQKWIICLKNHYQTSFNHFKGKKWYVSIFLCIINDLYDTICFLVVDST